VPIYEYKCTNGHHFEVVQKMSDEPLRRCQECGAAVERVFHPIAVHFKGSGFYSTDYGSRKEPAGASSDGAGESKEKASGEKASGEKASGEKASGESGAKEKSGSGTPSE
jgi:putative FmdB family regulatory protein